LSSAVGPDDAPILTIIALAVVANLGLMAAALVAERRRVRDGGDPAGARGPSRDDLSALPIEQRRRMMDLTLTSVSPEAFDRVVRVVAWIFLLSTTTIVSVTGLWRENQPAILVLLALAGFFVLLVHDLLPANTLGGAKFIVEGSVAITFAAVLVLLTGQDESPFFFTFPLIVGGAALVVTPRATVALAAVASGAYLIAVSVGRADVFSARTIAAVAVNLTALLLLAYIAMVIAREQRRARDEAVRISTIDPLTALSNRGHFFAALEREISRSARTGRRFCLLMMDLDELKAINDRYGHFHGDRVLRSVSEVIRSSVRRIDMAARYGGDEFVALLPETDPTGAWVLAEKIRLGVGELAIEVDGNVLKTSLSVGVVTHPDDGETADDLMIKADAAMYASKRAGKDRVMGVPAGQPEPVDERGPVRRRTGASEESAGTPV
jgi:diguanylate cyclase (GGDEF)-like protein